MNLNIFYLHYDTARGSKKDRPNWFSYEKCLVNLIDTIVRAGSDELKVNLLMVFDGEEADFLNDFSSKYFLLGKKIIEGRLTREVRLIKGGDAFISASKLIDIACNDYVYTDSSYIYNLENDYLHRYGWLDALVEVHESGIPHDYITLFDHPDKYRYAKAYNGRYDQLRSQLFVTASSHWRTTPSTCFSVISKSNILQDDSWAYKRLRDRYVQPFLKLFKGRSLLSAVPGYSTHCMSLYMSPVISWQMLDSDAENLIKKGLYIVS